MNLPGRLRLTTLGDVLGALHRSGASGVLELSEDRGATHRVYWKSGMITQVDTSLFRERLGELLSRQGVLEAGALARLARRLLEAPSRRAGEILVDEGIVSRDVVSFALRRQLRHTCEYQRDNQPYRSLAASPGSAHPSLQRNVASPHGRKLRQSPL